MIGSSGCTVHIKMKTEKERAKIIFPRTLCRTIIMSNNFDQFRNSWGGGGGAEEASPNFTNIILKRSFTSLFPPRV
jgi:hypothetical protein